jgi:hypothetical protein
MLLAGPALLKTLSAWLALRLACRSAGTRIVRFLSMLGVMLPALAEVIQRAEDEVFAVESELASR